MRNVVTRMAVVVALVFGGANLTAQAQQISAAGSWAGGITLPSGSLPMAVVLTVDGAGAWSGTIDIPSQGAKAVRLGNVIVNGRDVGFSMLGVPGEPRFAGTLSEDGQTIAGTFSQSGATLKFELKRGLLPVAARPQEPKPPYPYRADSVSYRNEAAGITLAGTLTQPQGNGPFPAVVLISGSGAQDRDSAIMGHKPFLLWADTLTRRGFVVLRVDDRGVGGSERGTVSPTSADFSGDVKASVAYLSGLSIVDPARVGLIGHSEGANIAAMVAADTPAVKFIVMLAGSGVRGDELLLQQYEALAVAAGAPRNLIDWQLTIRRRVSDQILAEQGKPDSAARQALIDGLPPLPGTTNTAPAREVANALFAAINPWMRAFMAADPREPLRRVKVPVLAVIGERDLQIPARENIPAIREALSGNTSATVLSLPGLNHLLQTATTGQVSEYAEIEETIAPSVLTMVGDWLVARGR